MGFKNMKKKVIGILVCMMLMAMIPAAAGLNCDIQETETKKIISVDPETEGLLDRTTFRGIVLFQRGTRGGNYKFFAIRLHYTTITLGGVKTGNILMKSITLPDVPNGYHGNFYIMGTFRGNFDNV